MTTQAIVSKVWSFCNTLRDDGVGYGDYLEQLTYDFLVKNHKLDKEQAEFLKDKTFRGNEIVQSTRRLALMKAERLPKDPHPRFDFKIATSASAVAERDHSHPRQSERSGSIAERRSPLGMQVRPTAPARFAAVRLAAATL